MPGKVYAKILNARIYKYAEDVDLLPETQCGFRAGRGVIDSVFCLKMCMAAIVHLVKAYGSISRSGLWEVLRKKGVSAKFVNLLKDYFSGKYTQVSGALKGVCLLPLSWVRAWGKDVVWLRCFLKSS